MSIQIDLTGPDGNIYALIGLAVKLAKSIAMTDDERDCVAKKMMAGNYNQLLDTLVDSFPGFDFEFENDPRKTE